MGGGRIVAHVDDGGREVVVVMVVVVMVVVVMVVVVMVVVVMVVVVVVVVTSNVGRCHCVNDRGGGVVMVALSMQVVGWQVIASSSLVVVAFAH